MNNKNVNGLNFDFDSPIEKYIVEDTNNSDEVFDLAAYASSNEKKYSNIKKNRLKEEIKRDRAIEREQENFLLNREKHAVRKEAARTAPHAITADELMRPKNTKSNHNSVNTESEPTEQKIEILNNDTDSVTQEVGYSDAAQLIFEKMRNIRKSESENTEETNKDYNMTFVYDAQKITKPQFNYVFNDGISEEISENSRKFEISDYDDEEPSFETEVYETSNDINNQIETDVDNNYDEPLYVDKDLPIQPLYMENIDLEDDFDQIDDTDFINNDDQLSLDDTVDIGADNDVIENDYIEDEFIDDLPPIGNYDDQDYDYDDEYEVNNEDVGFDLLDSSDELVFESEPDFLPNPITNKFDGLDEELLSDISPRKKNNGRNFNLSSNFVEYHNLDDEYNVRSDLKIKTNKFLIKFIGSLVVTVLSAILCIGSTALLFEVGSKAFWACILILNIAALIINFDSVKSIAYMFDGDVEIDLLPSIASIASLFQALLGVFSITIAKGNLVFTTVTTAVFAFYALGNYIRLKDITKNFDRIYNEDEKGIITFIEQPDSNKIMDGENDIGYRIAGRKNAVDIQNFMEYSMSTGPYDEVVGKVSIAAFIVSVILAVGIGIVSKSLAYAVVGLCGGLCIASPVSSLLMTIIGIRRVNDVLKHYNVLLPGYLSAENIDNTNVVQLEASDLFNGDNVKLYNIKTFNGLPLDEVIVDATALLTSENSPIKDMFCSMSHGETLPETDSVAYEDKMGLSGWVGGRKTLIGNRMIMETHGISVPPIEIDKNIILNGYFPVYFASEGKLSALFIVGYHADDTISYYLKQVFNAGHTLLVKTCDPNITEEMIADYFGIHRDSVKIMSHESEIFMSKTQKSDSATMLCSDTCGYLNGIISAIKLKKNSNYAYVAQILIIAVAFMLFGIVSFTGSLGFLNVSSLVVYNLISLLIIYIFHIKYI